MYRENAKKEEPVKITLTYDEVRQIVYKHLCEKGLVADPNKDWTSSTFDVEKFYEANANANADFLQFNLNPNLNPPKK